MGNINDQQLKILSKLLFAPKSRFKELNGDSLSTDTFSYHVKSLLISSLIKKEGSYYYLTPKGKMVASTLDADTSKVEKQPKVGAMLIAHKRINGKDMFVIQQRTKEPYFGYWGFMTGKVRWGETLSETANRELKEECGLEGTCRFCYEIHEMVYDKKTNDMLEDKFFHIVEFKNLRGKLAEKTKEGINKWVSAEEFLSITPKYHNENDLMNWFLAKDFSFK